MKRSEISTAQEGHLKSEQDKEKAKQPYIKPHLMKIDLAAEEVLAIGCKLPGGRVWPGMPNCGIDANCSTLGS